ncbi:MAG: hypothetical protein RXQ56_06265 [Thermoproteus sp.]
MDLGVVALIALNNMLLAFLIWVPPRGYFAAMLATALGQAALFGFPPGSIRRDLLIAPGLLDATVFLALDLFQADLRDVALITAVALAGIPKAEGEVGGSALACVPPSKRLGQYVRKPRLSLWWRPSRA